MNSGVINADTALLHHFLDVPQAQRIGRVPAHAGEHHIQRIVHALDHLLQGFDHRRGFVCHTAEDYRPAALQRLKERSLAAFETTERLRVAGIRALRSSTLSYSPHGM